MSDYLFKKILNLLKKNELIDMDKLIKIAMKKRLRIGVFPLEQEIG